MFLPFYIFLFILSLICFAGSILLRDTVGRLIFAVLSAITFMVLALASYDLEIVNVLVVNNTIIEHTTVVYSPSLAYIFVMFVVISILNAISLAFEIMRKEVKV